MRDTEQGHLHWETRGDIDSYIRRCSTKDQDKTRYRYCLHFLGNSGLCGAGPGKWNCRSGLGHH